METLYLGIVFLIIIGVLAFGRPLYQAILGGWRQLSFFFVSRRLRLQGGHPW